MKKLLLGFVFLSSVSAFAQARTDACILTTVKYDSQYITREITRYRSFFTVHKNNKLIGKFGINQYSDGVIEDNSENNIDDFYSKCDVPANFEDNLLNRVYKNGHVLSRPVPLCRISGLRQARQPITQSLSRTQFFFNISKNGQTIGRFGINRYTDGTVEDNLGDLESFYSKCNVSEDIFKQRLFSNGFQNGDGV